MNRTIPCVLRLLGTLVLAAPAAIAVPFSVTSAADAGAGTLREMISLAPAGATIGFDPQLSGQTIFLTTGQLMLAKSVVIDGSGLAGGITVSGNGISRIFHVASAQTVTLAALTLRGGLADRGGAIHNDNGTLTVSRCTLTGNLAQHGGGIYSDSALNGVKTTVVNSTIIANTATIRGGGIYNFDGLTELVHCTVTGNTAPAGEGGGVLSFGDAATQTTVRHSIIAGNSAADLDLVGSTPFNNFVSLGCNLAGTGEGIGNFTATGDRINAAPMLAPLGNYGGPQPIRPPLPGSPAIEGAVIWAGMPASDQRGAARPAGPLPDVGAVEAFPLGTLDLPSADSDHIADILEGPGGPYPQLNPAVDDSALDSDGDGTSDEEEIGDSTNPFDPASRFRVTLFEITELNPAGHKFTLDFTSFPGLSYAFEFSANVDFSQPRIVTLGTATDFLSGYSILRFSPGERFVRVRRAQ